MVKRLSTILLASMLASACVPEVGPATGGDTGGGGGSGGGGGGGGGDGSGSGSGGGSGGGALTATAFLGQISQKFCDEAFTCQASFPTDVGVTFADAFGASAAECVSASAAYDAPVEARVAAGTIQFNAADAATCVGGIAFGTCTEFWTQGPTTVPPACATALVGTLADGATCVIDYECIGATSYCDDATKKCTPGATGARTAPALDRLIALGDLWQ